MANANTTISLFNMFAAILLVVGFAQVITAAPKQSLSRCYEYDRELYPYFSTRTAYETVRGNISRPDASATCKPVQVWMLARHGTRYPGEESMAKLLEIVEIQKQIIENHEQGAGSLCPDHLKKLRDWQIPPDFKHDSAAVLSPQGEKDLYQLAIRLRNTFPELLKRQARNVGIRDYLLRSTVIRRSESSMRLFGYGLFGTTRTVVPHEKPPVNDTFLLAHKNCPLWGAGSDVEPVVTERNNFIKGPEMQSLIGNLSSRLGFLTLLKFEVVNLLYNMCRFDNALYPKKSIWCSFFTRDELKVLEYSEDLRQYYYSGPGRQMNVKLGCQTLSDMFKHFRNVATKPWVSEPRGVFYFAHTVTLQALMSALGINKEVKPLAAADYAASQNRSYRTSFLGPFATNIVATLYRCDEKPSSRFKVSFHVAEKLIEIPGCSDGLCDWDYLESKYGSDVKNCNMDFCNEQYQ